MNTLKSGVTPVGERRSQSRSFYFERRWHSKLPRHLEKRWRVWVDDPDNVTEYENVSRLHAMLRTLPPPSLPSAAELYADSVDLDVDVPDSASSWDTASKADSRHWRRPRVLALGGAIAVVIALVSVARVTNLPRITLVQAHVYETEPGGPRRFTLPDQSIVTLSGSARLKGFFSAHKRHLLLTRGEAFFDVRHNPAVPFQVDVESARIMDVGTTFNVRRYSDKVVEVSVTEGAVTVEPSVTNAAAADQPTPVERGEQVSYDEKGEITRPRAASREAVTSWISGRRIYRGKPLAKVIDDVQLYVPRRIDLDGALATVRFTGSIDQLDTHQAEQWVRGLPNIYPVEILETPHHMLIRCVSPGCPGVLP